MHLNLNQYYQLRDVVADGRRPDLTECFDNTSGMIYLEESIFLYHAARQVTQGCIVEVGSYRGRSTVFLARGSMDGNMAPVYAIEPHQDFIGILGGVFGPKDKAYFYRAMLDNKCGEVVRLVNLSSEIISSGWKDKISILWIDGDHSYGGVKRDFECWKPHLLPGALVIFDDATDPTLGPQTLINELTAAEEFKVVFQVGRISVLRDQALI